MSKISQSLNSLFEEHKFVRRFAFFWNLGLTTYATVMFFENLDIVNAAAAAAYGTVGTINGAVLAFYKWVRYKEDGPR